MTEPDPIDGTLTALRQNLANTLMLVVIAQQLREDSTRPLLLLRQILVELCGHIQQVLLLLPKDEGDNDADVQ
jgi:hypothetical protein